MLSITNIDDLVGYCDYDCEEDINLLSTLCMNPCEIEDPIDLTTTFDCLQNSRRETTVSDLDHCKSIINSMLNL